MKKFKILYYSITIIFTLFTLIGIYFELSFNKDSLALLTHLGYPVYFSYILGVGKALGLIGIWQNRISFLREWAYGGFVIDFIAAVFSHMSVGDPLSSSVPAIFNLILILLSYYSLYRIKK